MEGPTCMGGDPRTWMYNTIHKVRKHYDYVFAWEGQLRSCMAPTSLHTNDEINVFNQCAQFGDKYIVSTNLLCYECIPHKYKFGAYMADGGLTWFSRLDPQLCSQVAEQSVLLTRHIMHRVQR